MVEGLRYSLVILEFIPQLGTLDFNLSLALVLENTSVGSAMHGRLGDLVQVVVVPLVARERAAGRSLTDLERASIADNVAVCATAASVP